MKAVILAGGQGTRLDSVARNIPKSMVTINGLPLIEYQISFLKRFCIEEIILITHHLSEVIENYFGSGERWGVNIKYFREPFPLGTTGGIKEIEHILNQESFLILYGDLILDINLNKLLEFHNKHNGIGTLVLHPNNHPYDSDLVEIDEKNRIVCFHPKPHQSDYYYPNLVNAAVYIFSPNIFKYIPKGIKLDFGKDIFPKIVLHERLYGYISAEYIKDIGTPDRLETAQTDLKNGKVQRLNSENCRPAVFIDRDGVINKDVKLLCKLEDFVLLPGVSEALQMLNQSDYLTIIVTNQSVVARNLCSMRQLKEIHNKMETLLGRNRAYLDAIFLCPHHPDKGYPEENTEYKISCNCRKPKTGMIEKAKSQFNIDLKRSYMVGDSDCDIQCGIDAGLKTIRIFPDGESPTYTIHSKYIFKNLYEAACFILDK